MSILDTAATLQPLQRHISLDDKKYWNLRLEFNVLLYHCTKSLHAGDILNKYKLFALGSMFKLKNF